MIMNQAPEPTFLLNLMLAAVLVGNAVAIWLGIANGKKMQRREVSFSEVSASKKEFDQFTAVTNANFVQVREEMKQDRQANQVHASERSKTLFNEMKETRMELLERTEHVRIELSEKIDANRRELNQKLDKQLPETIATIINAKKV